MFLKLKSDEVTIKGRGCVYRRKQQDWLSKEDVLSPTVSTKGIVLSFVIGAMEVWEFLQTDYDKGDIYIKLEGSMVTLLEEINPEYYKKIIHTNKRIRKCM